MIAAWRPLLLMAVTGSIIFAAALIDPIAQDPLYHRFTDQRTLFGLPNFLNVTSNAPFLLAGAAGLSFIVKARHPRTLALRLAWLVFFFGIAVTALGSSYYHLSPGNESLVWDRLPMTVSFMSLVAIIIGEYHSTSLAGKLLLPLLIAGLASVMYWSYTEHLGRGDLRPYAIVQFLPMLLIPLTIGMYASRSDLGRYVWWMIGLYLLAKLAELFDTELYSLGQIASGHSLKHLIAAMAPVVLLYGLRQRESAGRT